MKPMSLLVCGIVVSSLSAAVTVHAESSAGNFALRASTTTTQAGPQDWRKESVRGNDLTGAAPRGDLRSDIANNARARPEPERGNHLRKR